jgi:hypothetical protein
MSAKILEFDVNRRVPPRYYTPIAMRGRLLHMPSQGAKRAFDAAAAEKIPSCPTETVWSEADTAELVLIRERELTPITQASVLT